MLERKNMETNADRRRRKLAQLCEERGLRGVAERAELNHQSLDQIIKGVLLPPKLDGSRSPRKLGDDAARRIEEAEGLGRGWFDLPDAVAPDMPAPAPAEVPGDDANGPPDLVIAQYAAGGAMGMGLELEERPPGLIKSWRVDHEWLRLNVSHHTGIHNLCIVTGFGPSMKPKYNPGDPLLCDRGVVTVESDGVYFFRVGRHGFIKQLQRIPTEAGMVLRAKSFNRDYDPFDITEKMDFQVFGKILTAWKSEQL